MAVLLVAGVLSFVRRIRIEDSALAERFGTDYEKISEGDIGVRSVRQAAAELFWHTIGPVERPCQTRGQSPV